MRCRGRGGAGRLVVAPSWSSASRDLGVGRRSRVRLGRAYGSWCGCPPRCAPRAAGRARRCPGPDRCRPRAVGSGCAAGDRRAPSPRGSTAGIPSIMPAAGRGASDSCAAGAGATRAEIGVSSTRWAATAPPTSRRVVASSPGSVPPSRLSTRAGPGHPHVTRPAGEGGRGAGREVDDRQSGRVAVEGLLDDREDPLDDTGARRGGHGQHVPDLLDDLLVVRVGEQHPVGTAADQHTSPTGVPRLDDQRRLPSYAPTPPSSPIAPVRRTRSRLVGCSSPYILSSG